MPQPVESHTVTVHGQKMHYLTCGQKGKPVVFVHGMPTSSYLWRNILPTVGQHAQCYALDLIGMGHSAKPKITYSITEHIDYFTGFIEALQLSEIILVMHGWGSVIGLSYAKTHEKNIAGLAMIESYLHLPKNTEDLPIPVQELLQLTKEPIKLKKLILEENYLVEKLLPHIMEKRLTLEEHAHYREPFHQKDHRQVLFQFIMEQPYINEDSPSRQLITNYLRWLQHTPVPKLLMYGMPGILTSMTTVEWAIGHFSNLTVVEVGEGLHYLPETRAREIAQTLSEWLP